MPKGVYYRTEKTRLSLSLAARGKPNKNKGKSLSDAAKLKMRLAHLGKHLSEQHRKNIGLANKGKHKNNTGKFVSAETRLKMRLSQLGKKRAPLSAETRKKMSLGRKGRNSGSKSNFWKGGITPTTKLIRSIRQYHKWRFDVFSRDNFVCQNCGNRGGRLEAHHKKYFREIISEIKNSVGVESLFVSAMAHDLLWDINNGITLCKSCHKNEHKKNGHHNDLSNQGLE